MKRIYTRVDTFEAAYDLCRFIRSLGYEGVQNDSLRYCKESIEIALDDNERHHDRHCYIGVNGYRIVVGANRKKMRRQESMKYIEKERIFRELLEEN